MHERTGAVARTNTGEQGVAGWKTLLTPTAGVPSFLQEGFMNITRVPCRGVEEIAWKVPALLQWMVQGYPEHVLMVHKGLYSTIESRAGGLKVL